MGRGRVSAEEKAQRLRDTEIHILRIGSYSATVTALCKRHNVCRRTAEGWITEVRRTWAEEAKQEEKEFGAPIRVIRRTKVRQMLHDIHAQAQSQQEVVFGPNGEPVMREDGNGRLVPMTRTKINFAAALQAIKQLRQLDGLDEPRKKAVEHRHEHKSVVEINDPFEGRTDAEQRFFLAKGRWPSTEELKSLLS